MSSEVEISNQRWGSGDPPNLNTALNETVAASGWIKNVKNTTVKRTL